MKSLIVIVLLLNPTLYVLSIGEGSVFIQRDQPRYGHFNDRYKLKVSAFHYPPFFMIINEANGSTAYSGYSVDILKGVSHHLQYEFSFIPVNRSEITKYGITQAIINQLVVSKEVELIPMVLVPTVQRSRQMDFTIPVLVGKNRLMLRFPEEESSLAVIGRPFTFWTWIIFGLSTLVLIGTMVIVNNCHNNLWNDLSNKPHQFTHSIWEIIGWNMIFILSIITGQGMYLPRTFRMIARFLIGLWCLTAVVIGNAYTSTLTSFLSAPKLKPIINSLKELAVSDHYKLTAELNAAPTETYLRATSGYYKVLGDTLRQNPHLLFRDYDQATENVLKKDAVLIRGSIDVLTRISDDMRVNKGNCRLTASQPMGDDAFLSFGLTKEHPKKRIIDKGLTRLTESGLLGYWFNLYNPNIDKCLIKNNHLAKVNQKKTSSLNIINLSAIFLSLVIGLTVAFFAFLCELLIH